MLKKKEYSIATIRLQIIHKFQDKLLQQTTATNKQKKKTIWNLTL